MHPSRRQPRRRFFSGPLTPGRAFAVIVVGGTAIGGAGGILILVGSAAIQGTFRPEWSTQYLPGIVLFFLFACIEGAGLGAVVGLVTALVHLGLHALGSTGKRPRTVLLGLCVGVAAGLAAAVVAAQVSDLSPFVLGAIAGVLAAVGAIVVDRRMLPSQSRASRT